MNIQELTKDNFKALGGIKTKNSEQLDQINALKYIQHLAETTRTDISNWNLLEVFGDGENLIGCLMNKQEINKRFFNEKMRAVEPSEYLTEDQLKAISEIGNKSTEGEKRQIRTLIENYLSEARRFNSKCSFKLQKAAIESERLAMINGENISEKYKKDIESVIKAGFWKLSSIQGDCITFKTTAEVTLEWNGMKCNFGHYRFSYYKGNVSILPGSNNIIMHGEYPHPHTRSSGGVCWGTAINPLNEAIKSSNLFAISQVCASLISHYNHRNPYATFMSYYSTRNSLDRVSRYMNGLSYEQPTTSEDLVYPFYMRGNTPYRENEKVDIILADCLRLKNDYSDGTFSDSNLKDIARWAEANYSRLKTELENKPTPQPLTDNPFDLDIGVVNERN